MFKIGEFSKLVRVSARMLRYYDKCGLLRPAETDHFTGYRMYSAAQIPVLFQITTLRDMGFGINEMEKILPHFHNVEIMQKTLAQKSSEIHSAITFEQNKLDKIAAMSGILEKERVNMVYDVELKSLKAEKVLSLRKTIPAEREEELWEKLWTFIAHNNVEHAVGGYSLYYGDEYEESNVDTEIAVPVLKFGKSKDHFQYRELEALPQAATIRFSGPYEGYNTAMEKLALWMDQNGYELDGSVRGFAIVAPMDGVAPEEYVTELQMPVKKSLTVL